MNMKTQYCPPTFFWTDKSDGNTADVIRDHLRIKHNCSVVITPHNPEQNGKIESWWQK